MAYTEEDVKRYLKDANEAVLKAAHRGTVRAGLLTARLARDYAPRSPSEAEKRAAKRDPRPAKRGRLSRIVKAVKKWVDKHLRRKKRRASSGKAHAVPGGLEKSIDTESIREGCSIFVASNSPAGKYAKRIHDEKGKKWWKRGPGTVRKGAQADEKFIERAVNARRQQNIGLVMGEILKVTT